jgi:hypothetical protein
MLMRAGMRDLTLRGMSLELADLTMLATLRRLSWCTSMTCKSLSMTLGTLLLSSMYHDKCA